ncbi:PREDICTED: BTB/POZ domain-containing protein At1g67900-like [Tarenaya hassleriana]|uniref:BTB/POZ domain-containing protein At1g67900-like n=1 Tax=Tarenaya hassleriana TaxID=28532 RepID=UPI00053C3B3C|nr:PREDICTED: BTB/POZ domain-containing protein At1g67900-like [Tarenaya hassleriana]XP_010531581.1 PREDICTED: BTB/POZ domain-containing protein At1g67900-like [Tarenaya hassleriana]
MKFMKLGSRPDTFYTSDSVRCVSSEVSSDIVIEVSGCKYLLHKFPLLSKCLKLQRIFSESPEASQNQTIRLPDFPGGAESFELCAKFCYGITITISAYNIVAARCAAEYLQMTEEVEKGNLVYKLEVFFNSCILHGWRDAIVTLQTTKAFTLWSEDLAITSRCIEAIASKVLSHPSKVSLSHSHSRRVRDDVVSCNGGHNKPASRGWWAEDIAELGIDLYWRTMIAIKSGGKVPSALVGDALRVYASKWLPGIPRNGKLVCKRADSGSDSDSAEESTSSKHRLLLESIISLLPSEKGAVSCGFLLKLLKTANVLNASSSSKMELARRVALQLDEASVSDLLIPSMSYKSDMLYDVDIVTTILEQFMLQGQSPPTSPQKAKPVMERRRRSRSAENIDIEFQESRRSSSASHSSKLKVAKLVDGYLQQIARDKNLPLSKFITLAESIPEFSRLDHNDLYRAIDIYLKAHPDLNKTERKRLCRILDCKKLSMEACMHAAQNEMLPLRVVVQVLFYEHSRAAATGGGKMTELPSHIKALLAAHNIDPSKPDAAAFSTTTSVAAPEDQWSVKSPKTKSGTLRSKLAEDEYREESFMSQEGGGRTPSRFKAFCAIPARPKKIFTKLLSINHKNSSDKN